MGLEPRLADHRTQAARSATLPTAPPRQASMPTHRDFRQKLTVRQFTNTAFQNVPLRSMTDTKEGVGPVEREEDGR